MNVCSVDLLLWHIYILLFDCLDIFIACQLLLVYLIPNSVLFCRQLWDLK